MEANWIEQMEQWRTFFLLTGSGSFMLAGLLFLVIPAGPRATALLKNTGIRAFVLPSPFFFAATLLMSSIFLVPSISQYTAGCLLCMQGVLCLIYVISAKAHLRRLKHAMPLAAWIWFIALPYTSFLLALVAGIQLLHGESQSLDIVAIVSVLWVVLGIRNAWDVRH